jgi:hypothetical protein
MDPISPKVLQPVTCPAILAALAALEMHLMHGKHGPQVGAQGNV